MESNGKRALVTGALLQRRGANVAAALYNSFNIWGWLGKTPRTQEVDVDGFAPTCPLPEGITRTVEWFRHGGYPSRYKKLLHNV